MYPNEVQEDVPVPAELVDEPQVPVAAAWSWDTNKLLILAASVVALGFGIYFVLSFTSAKRKHEAAEASGDGA